MHSTSQTENSDLHRVRASVVRLERYCRRAKDKIWSADCRDLVNALADIAEAGEIARRLYTELGNYIRRTKSADDENRAV